MLAPLADRMRPTTLEEVVGQAHLLGEGKILRGMIASKQIQNLIFYGPSGVGKTTMARLIATMSDKLYCPLNATSASTADIKAIIDQRNTLFGRQGILLYLDEIQYLNKKQQQILLEHMENGSITLVASTTENPYFSIYNAILSRSIVFEFHPIAPIELQPVVCRAFETMRQDLGVAMKIEDGVVETIATLSNGDVRKAISMVELCALSSKVQDHKKEITLSLAKQFSQNLPFRYDREGDEHYDLLSALQKSIRGSDPDAAVHYLAKLLQAGNLLSPCRRLLVTASEDIGLAYPQAIVVVKACVDAALQVGLPEARIPLAQATILLATAPKSNSSYLAMEAAISDLKLSKGNGFPRKLQNKHYDGEEVAQKGQHYLYPHDFKNHYVKQQYLPDDLSDTTYYIYGENKFEQVTKKYWSEIKKYD